MDSTTFWQSVSTHFCISLALVKEKYIIVDISKTRPGLQVNEIHSPYDRQHEVSSSPNPHLNERNHFLLEMIVSNMKYLRSKFSCFYGHK